MRDITDRKLMEQELIKAKDKAEENNRLKSAFLANMSHEIRTPMNVLLGFSNLLASPGIEDNKRKEFISRIRESGERLLHLIDDIIDSAKIEAGQLVIQEMEVPVNKLLEELRFNLEEQKRAKGKENIEICLNTMFEGAGITTITDSFRLKQVLSNLLNNALKYTDSGFIEAGYSILPADSGDEDKIKVGESSRVIQFYVKDTGIGIPETRKDFIFERFHKIEDQKVKLYEGAGLGLTICKSLVKLLGGKIWVESEPGEGSTFYFTIPYKPVPSVLKEAKPEINNGGNNTVSWKNKVILVVEDEESNYRLIEEILRSTKVQLIWLKDGREAIEKCKSVKNIDLVLMDIKLPFIDGYSAVKSIKKIRKDLTIIANTAYVSDIEKEKSFKAGCDDYISKPVQPDKLLERIKKYI